MIVVRGMTALDDFLLSFFLIVLTVLIIIVPFVTPCAVYTRKLLGLRENEPFPLWLGIAAFFILFICFFFTLHGF